MQKMDNNLKCKNNTIIMTNKIDKFRGILGKAKDTLIGKGLEQFTSLSRKTQMRVALLLFFGGLALKGSTQEVAGFTRGAFNEMIQKIYYPNGAFAENDLTTRYDEQVKFAKDALSNDKRLRVLGLEYTLHTLPDDVYDQIVDDNNIDITNGLFNNHVRNQGWSKDFYYTLQTDKKYGSYMGTAGAHGAMGEETGTIFGVNLTLGGAQKEIESRQNKGEENGKQIRLSVEKQFPTLFLCLIVPIHHLITKIPRKIIRKHCPLLRDQYTTLGRM